MSRDAGNFYKRCSHTGHNPPPRNLWMAQVFLPQSISSSGQRRGDICGGVANAITCDVCWKLGVRQDAGRRWDSGALDINELGY